MPLFSKANKNDADGDNDSHPRSQPPAHDGEQPPADERTRLLPARGDAGRGMLAPDDPAVTPYNLWSIRILRYLTLFVTALTLAWWLLLLVSAFATPPGLNTRGSSFSAYSFASLALANMLFTLVFFGVPSKSVRILAIITALMLFLDLVLLASVQQTRHEEGWVGLVSATWALLMSIWALLADRAVKWGKEEEEERLTGRAETRRTLSEWLAVLLSTIAYVVMAVAVLLMTLTIILRALDAGIAPPGKLYEVDGGKYRVHVYCHGNATDRPTVLFEGGEKPVEHGLWQLADKAVRHRSFSRFCFIDRPGYGWSDTAPSPLSAGFAVDVLSEALAAADEKGPWVLASAGIGSIYSRVFSSRHAHEVRGLVLIDPLHEDLLDRVASPGRGFLLWLRGVISPLGLDRLSGAIFRGRTSRDRIYGRAASQGSKLIFARLQENLVANSFTRRDVQGSRRIQDQNTALVVISSGVEMKRSERWAEKQRDLTKLTDNLKHWDVVDEAPHEVWESSKGSKRIEERLRQLVHA